MKMRNPNRRNPLNSIIDDYLTKEIHFHPMRKNPHGIILKMNPKEQYLSTVFKPCSK